MIPLRAAVFLRDVLIFAGLTALAVAVIASLFPVHEGVSAVPACSDCRFKLAGEYRVVQHNSYASLYLGTREVARYGWAYVEGRPLKVGEAYACAPRPMYVWVIGGIAYISCSGAEVKVGGEISEVPQPVSPPTCSGGEVVAWYTTIHGSTAIDYFKAEGRRYRLDTTSDSRVMGDVYFIFCASGNAVIEGKFGYTSEPRPLAYLYDGGGRTVAVCVASNGHCRVEVELDGLYAVRLLDYWAGQTVDVYITLPNGARTAARGDLDRPAVKRLMTALGLDELPYVVK